MSRKGSHRSIAGLGQQVSQGTQLERVRTIGKGLRGGFQGRKLVVCRHSRMCAASAGATRVFRGTCPQLQMARSFTGQAVLEFPLHDQSKPQRAGGSSCYEWARCSAPSTPGFSSRSCQGYACLWRTDLGEG